MTQMTIGLPVFNAMPYLHETVESILRQTHSDFAVLAINDGSTDGSLEYLKSLRDHRFHVRDQQNQGLTATLNRMLHEVETPWLVRLDADDVAYPDRLARTIEHIERYPDAGMFYSPADYYPGESFGRFRSTQGTPEEIRQLVRSGYLPSICHPTVTLNVNKAKAAGGYRFDLHVEDIDLWWRIALQHDIRRISEATVGFRQHPQSVSSANLDAQAVNTLYVQYLLLSHLWNRAPLQYEQVREPLSRLFSRRRLKSKEHLRASNMQIALGNTVFALQEAARSLLTCPRYFAERVIDEFLPRKPICMGEPPSRFAQFESDLWAVQTAPDARLERVV
jgi:hypothetical protein